MTKEVYMIKDLLRIEVNSSFDGYYYSSFESYSQLEDQKIVKIKAEVNSYDDATDVSKEEVEESKLDFGQIIHNYIKDGIDTVYAYVEKQIKLNDIELNVKDEVNIHFSGYLDDSSSGYSEVNIYISKELFQDNMIQGLTKYSFDAKKYSKKKVVYGSLIEYKGKQYFFKRAETEQ